MHLFVKVYSPIYNVHTFLYWGCVLQTKRQFFITVYYTIGTICTPYIPYESYKILFNVRIFRLFHILKVLMSTFHIPIFRRPITRARFRLVQACSFFRRPITLTHFKLLQACTIFK